MSLQVWLPLNGNLEQNGVSSTIADSNNISINSNGKIGKCIEFNTSITSGIYSNNFNTNLWTECSITLWLKIVSFNATWDTYLQIGDGNTPWNSYIVGLLRNNANSNLVFCISNGTTSTQASFTTPNLETGIWYHIACVYKPGHCLIYINGNLHADNTTTIVPNFSSSTKLFIGGLPSAYKTKSCMNDLRIYDHALSIKEIKEISKALVCHYPLDANGLGMPNYFLNSNFATSTTANWYGVNNSSISIATKDGRKCITGTKGTSNNICGQTIDTYSYVANSEITFTISADVYVEETGTFGVGNWISTTEASGWQGMSGSQTWHTSNTLKVGWNHISVTRVNGKNQYNGKIVTAFSYSGTTYWMTNIKFEFGIIDTPWIPNSGDASYSIFNINGTTEFDTSGYKYNGTRSGSLSASSDTPRYSTCTVIPNQSYIKYRGPENMYYATYSFWVKFNSFTAYGAIHIPYTSPSGGGSPWFSANTESSSLWCYFGGNSPNYTKAGTGNLVTNTWYHFVYVWNNGVAQWYLNGEKIGNSVTYTTRTYIQNNADSTIGNSYTGSSWNGTPFNGSISDFRLYATALSDADILELYNTGASIDNGGNVFTGDIIETSGLVKPTIEKNAIIQNNEFDESEAMNLVLDNSIGQKAYFTYSYTPAKDTINSCLRPCYVDFSVIPNLSTSTTLRAIIQVTWSGFDTSSTAGTFAMYWSGDNFKISTNAWAWEGTNPIMAAISAKYDIKNLVLSATSGSYIYDVTFNLTQSYINTYSRARIGVRTDYSNGTAKFSMDKIILIEDKYSSTSSTKAHMGQDFMAGASFIEK